MYNNAIALMTNAMCEAVMKISLFSLVRYSNYLKTSEAMLFFSLKMFTLENITFMKIF